jgi:hypothetical protein
VRAARAGLRTLKRGILFNTLSRTSSGQRPGLLEQALRQPGKLVGRGLAGSFYEPEALFDAAANRALFYSPAVRFVEGAKQKQATARDWKAILAKAPGVKKAELDWLGVEDWLDAHDGQISREALSQFLRESQIEVVEDRLAGEEQKQPWLIGDVDYDKCIEPDWTHQAELYEDDAREEVEDGPNFAQRVNARTEQLARDAWSEGDA